MANTRPTITEDQLRDVRSALKSLPAKRTASMTAREAVFAMRKDILASREKGYEWDEIAQQLAAGGIVITPVTLRGYVQRSGITKKPEPAPANPATATVQLAQMELPSGGDDR